MKQSRADFFKKAKNKYLQEQAFISKFIRYWGTFWYNGVEYLLPYNNYYTGGGYPWSNYTSIFNNSCTGINVNGMSGFAPACSRQRKLLEFLKAWDKVSAQNMGGIESAWLLLNPGKDAAQLIIMMEQLNNYIDTHKDAQGRIKFKVRILANSSFIPGIGFVEDNINSDALIIPNYTSYNTVIENTIKLDALGNPILDSLGNPIPATEAVRSYDVAESYIRANATNIWKNNLVIPADTDIYGNPITSLGTSAPHTSEGSLHSLLARYALLFLPADEVRIEYIQKGILPYTVEQTNSDMVVGNNFVGPLDPTYNASNGNYNNNSGYVTWGVTYNIPTYDITFVVKNPTALSSTDTFGTQLTTDYSADYTKINPDLLLSYYSSYFSSWENNIAYFYIYGRVNGYMSKNIISLEESSSNPWGFYVPGTKIFNDPLNMWTYLPVDAGYWILRKDALTTANYIPLKKDRIAYIQSLLDTKYHQKSAGWLSIIIMIVAVIVAIVIAVLSYGTLSGYSYALLGAVAIGVTTFSLLLSLGAMLAQSMGSYADAAWISQFNKSIAPLVMVASIFLAVQSLWTIAQNALQSAGTIAGQSLAQTARQLVDKIIQWVKQKIVNFGIQDAMKIVSKAAEMWEKNKISKLQGDIQAKQEELQKYQEANEQSKYGDVWKSFSQMLLNPLAMLGSSYEFDRPYEPIYGQIHSGNSCRTTVLGLYGQGAEMYVSNIK